MAMRAGYWSWRMVKHWIQSVMTICAFNFQILRIVAHACTTRNHIVHRLQLICYMEMGSTEGVTAVGVSKSYMFAS